MFQNYAGHTSDNRVTKISTSNEKIKFKNLNGRQVCSLVGRALAIHA